MRRRDGTPLWIFTDGRISSLDGIDLSVVGHDVAPDHIIRLCHLIPTTAGYGTIGPNIVYRGSMTDDK
jgi:hypothetical protein